MYVFMERLREDYVDGEQFYDDDLNLICHNVNELDDIKQNNITDLNTIRSGAALGATSVQQEVDPTVPSWAKQPTKPSYTAEEVGAAAIDDSAINSGKTWSSAEIKDQLDTKQNKEIPEPLCFIAQEVNSTIRMRTGEYLPNIEYSLDDKQTWATWDYSQISLENGAKVFIRGFNPDEFSSSEDNNSSFIINGRITVSGNIMSLIDYKEFVDGIPCEYYFSGLFLGCTGLTDASELVLGTTDTDLSEGCYNEMFMECSSLVNGPKLLGQSLADDCYNAMFYGCTSLTAAPELPATTLSQYCYEDMFYGCTSLTTAPELPATTLAKSCYESMFLGCTSLTTAPELPATTLADSCYNSMFYNCSDLNYIKCLAVNGINQNSSTTNWVDGVASTGTFVKESTVIGWTLDNVNGIPSGWTVYNHYSDVELDKIIQQLLARL